jgi:hypothetical protein
MIQLPRRSVTRFFIPLIDVLTVLFCIFLLMPIFNEAKEEDVPPPGAARDADSLARELKAARQELDRLRKKETPLTAAEREQFDRLQKRLRRLQAEQNQPLEQRYAIFVLNIDPATGRLYYYDPQRDRRVYVRSRAAARKLVGSQREQAGGRELYFLIQVPRQKGRFPQRKQLKQYDGWLRGVRHGFDRPPGKL